jgi:hypothetical protein
VVNNNSNLPRVDRRARITGTNRAALGAKVKRAYEDWGLGVRQIAEATGPKLWIRVPTAWRVRRDDARTRGRPARQDGPGTSPRPAGGDEKIGSNPLTKDRSRAQHRLWLNALTPMAALVFPMWWWAYRQSCTVYCRHCDRNVVECVHMRDGHGEG